MTVTETSAIASVPRQLLIGGTWVDSSSGATLDVADPATGKTLCAVADATPEDSVRALDAAAAAQADWAATAPRERGEILRRGYQAMIDAADELAMIMTLEMGKSLGESHGEVTYAAGFLRWFAEEAVRISGRWAEDTAGGGKVLVMRQPVGPCLLITPWNFPAAMATRKIGPAVAAGCTMIVKPASATPLTTLRIAQLMQDAGLPAGVLNVITSSSAKDVTGPLLSDDRLRKLSFTGSTGVGRMLMEQASENLLRLSMELGGNAPLLVFDDADLDVAVQGAMDAKMRNMGQSCVAANRIHVHESIAEPFVERFVERMAAQRVGRGTQDGVDVGPLINAEQRDTVEELVRDAVERGATVRCGGERPDGEGFFYPPTVLTGVPDDARILHEEVFGPVAPITTFATEEEALDLANRSEYGLVAYAFTESLRRALRVAERLEVGMLGINKGLVSNPSAPFGGVKASGFGREGGAEGINEYLNVKYVAIDA